MRFIVDCCAGVNKKQSLLKELTVNDCGTILIMASDEPKFKLMKNKFVIAAFMIISVAFGASAQKVAIETDSKAGWHKIAETVANLKSDRDEVLVTGADHFKAIRLKVTDAPVEITDLTVVFENGQKQDIQVRNLIKAGDQTRVIDLEGQNRAIKKIVIMYKSAPTGDHDKARVEIWGMK